MTIEELIQKYRNAMTEEPSTVNHYCNMFIRDLKQLQKENEELKSFKDKVFNLLDKKLEEYPYLTLTEKWDNNCKYKHSCRENHEKNVAYASVNTTLNKLKEELSQE